MEEYRGSSPEDVGQFYDTMGPFFSLVWGQSMHGGYWHDEEDDAPGPVAQNRLTDMLIERTSARSGDRVLDLGCGVGGPALRLIKKRGCDVLGITISTYQATAANHLAQREGIAGQAVFWIANALKLPFSDSSFDVVWALESIFHMPDRRRVLREAFRVLRAGGQIVIADMTQRAPMNEEQRAIVREMHVNSLVSFDEYVETIREAGFEVTEAVDLSGHTTRMGLETARVVEEKRDEIIQIYGEEFAAAMEGAWVAVTEVFDKTMGYLIVAAEKAA